MQGVLVMVFTLLADSLLGIFINFTAVVFYPCYLEIPREEAELTAC